MANNTKMRTWQDSCIWRIQDPGEMIRLFIVLFFFFSSNSSGRTAFNVSNMFRLQVWHRHTPPSWQWRCLLCVHGREMHFHSPQWAQVAALKVLNHSNMYSTQLLHRRKTHQHLKPAYHHKHISAAHKHLLQERVHWSYHSRSSNFGRHTKNNIKEKRWKRS